MGRPRKGMPTVIYTVKFSLTPGEDDDLIAFLDAAPARCRAAAVKAAMPTGSLARWIGLSTRSNHEPR